MHSSVEVFATVCFGLALLHTFSVKAFLRWALTYPPGSVLRHFLHILSEVEVVFGFWAIVFLIYFSAVAGLAPAIEYLETRHFTEPAFVFVIMAVCSTRPILQTAAQTIEAFASMLPFPKPLAFFATALTLGPLAGSLITEPAAMTVTALLLLERFYRAGISQKLKYTTLGLLFVNISIGGTLTPYAAPPVLMVAKHWNWHLWFMLQNFGWKALLAILISTALVAFRFRKELAALGWKSDEERNSIPLWVRIAFLAIVASMVMSAHHPTVFIGVFFIFLGLVAIAKAHQKGVPLREPFLVSFFLAGLVVLGGPQRWWLEPLLTRLHTLPLYLGSIALTAVTDNAALTYLGSQVPSLSTASRYALVAGSVVGGGLTVIANAPNPAGFGILQPAFGRDGVSALRLFLSALVPTSIAAACFWFL